MKEKEQSLNIDTDVLAVHVCHYTLLAAYNVCMLWERLSSGERRGWWGANAAPAPLIETLGL